MQACRFPDIHVQRVSMCHVRTDPEGQRVVCQKLDESLEEEALTRSSACLHHV